MHDTSEMAALLVSRFPDVRRAPESFFIVGGAVRDLLIEEHPLDVDLAGTKALEAARQFAHATHGRLIELGRDPLRVWRIFAGGRIYDFAELHGGSIESDLARRDFTIDALAWRMDERRLIDLFGGVRDLRAAVIRMVSEQNLVDDPLRMLKAVRMAARFGFVIEPSTAEAIRRHAHLLSTVAPERVTYELDGVLSSSRTAEGLAMMQSLGLDLFDGAVDHPGEAGDAEVKLALMLRDRSAEEVKTLGERWRWSRDRVETVVALLRARASREALPVAIHDAGPYLAPRIAKFLEDLGDPRAGEYRELLGRSGTGLFATRALLTGDEIAALAGVDAGPKLGSLKRRLLKAQLLGEVTSREEAERFIAASSEE